MKSMLNELNEEKGKLLQFYKREKSFRWFLAILIIIIWGIKFVYDDVFIDSEIMMANPAGLIHSWYGSNRFGLIVTKKIFGMIRLVPYLSNIMFAIALWNAAMLLCFAISAWKGDSHFSGAGKYLFGAMLVTAPCLAEQYAFTLQAFEVTMGMIYCMIAVYCSGKLLYDKGSILWGLPAIGFMIWGFASYQALASYCITLVLISFISSNEREQGKYGWKCVVEHILLFLISFVGYLVLAYIFKTWKGASSAYVDSMFVWRHLGLKACLQNILGEFQKIYMGRVPQFFPRFCGMTIFFAVLYQVCCALTRKIKLLSFHMLATIGLAFAPLYVTIITGAGTPMRAQLVFPLILAYYSSVILEGISFIAERAVKNVSVRKFLLSISLAIGMFAAWRQGMNTVQLCETFHDAFQRDTLTAQRLYADICRVANREDMQNCKVAFVGMRDARLPDSALKGEAIGRSYFNWGITEIGVGNRANSLINLLGMNLQTASPQEYNMAIQACEEKESWPSKESVFAMPGTEGDIIVVKLSD